VAEATWDALAGVLPTARELAGAFPPRSGPNCFGTVMGAAGVTGAAATWMQREPFEQWALHKPSQGWMSPTKYFPSVG
jgi:hypothetical protein